MHTSLNPKRCLVHICKGLLSICLIFTQTFCTWLKIKHVLAKARPKELASHLRHTLCKYAVDALNQAYILWYRLKFYLWRSKIKCNTRSFKAMFTPKPNCAKMPCNFEQLCILRQLLCAKLTSKYLQFSLA